MGYAKKYKGAHGSRHAAALFAAPAPSAPKLNPRMSSTNYDATGKLYAHGTTTCMLMRGDR